MQSPRQMRGRVNEGKRERRVPSPLKGEGDKDFPNPPRVALSPMGEGTFVREALPGSDSERRRSFHRVTRRQPTFQRRCRWVQASQARTDDTRDGGLIPTAFRIIRVTPRTCFCK